MCSLMYVFSYIGRALVLPLACRSWVFLEFSSRDVPLCLTQRRARVLPIACMAQFRVYMAAVLEREHVREQNVFCIDRRLEREHVL
jgi:hypothetical protein